MNDEVDGQYVLGVVGDLVSNFLYYDRKGDDTLKVGMIEQLIDCGEVSVDQIVDRFRSQLIQRGLK